MVEKSGGSDGIGADWVRGQLLLRFLFVQGCWGFEFSYGGLFEESFESFVDSFDSFDFFVFFFELDGFLLVFELGLSECVLFFEGLFFGVEEFLDALVFEFVEVVFVFFEFFVELKFLKFGFFDLIGEFLDLRGLERKLFFDIFLLLDFFSVVFKFGFEGIDFGDELGFFVVG